MLIWASLIPYLTAPSWTALKMVLLSNFHGIPWNSFLFALKNSAILTLVVPTVATLIGLALSWNIVKSKTRLSGLFDVVSFLPHAIPNLIFAVGALFIALFWLPTYVPFYGTIFIIIECFFICIALDIVVTVIIFINHRKLIIDTIINSFK